MPSAVDTKAQLRAGQLLEAVSNAERERAAAPNEVPLGEWSAFRVRPSLTLQSLTTQLQLPTTPSTSAQVRRFTAAFAFSCWFSCMSLLLSKAVLQIKYPPVPCDRVPALQCSSAMPVAGICTV